MVKDLPQNSTHGTELILNYTYGAELKERRQEARTTKGKFFASYLKKKNSTPLEQ